MNVTPYSTAFDSDAAGSRLSNLFKKTPMKILLIGNHICGNRGDATIAK